MRQQKNGLYQIECWGASGGDKNTYIGGRGAYTKGNLLLSQGTVIYIYVGGEGSNTDIGGYNGGSNLTAGQRAYGSSGGGATDIRVDLLSSELEWNNAAGLRKRIMVAGGGGGANDRNSGDQGAKYGAGNGGAGGELVGITGESVDWQATATIPTYNSHSIGTGGTQVSGGRSLSYRTDGTLTGDNVRGSFGTAITNSFVQSGGGSGYYGGGCSGHGGAGGGSSFISGYLGCNAIDKDGNHTNQPNHYLGYVFSSGNMIAGTKKCHQHEQMEK